MSVKVMFISSSPVFATPNWGGGGGAPVLEFSMLLEATEAVAMYVHASCS